MPSHNLLCQGTSGVEANGINALFQEKDDCCIHVEMKLLYPATVTYTVLNLSKLRVGYISIISVRQSLERHRYP